MTASPLTGRWRKMERCRRLLGFALALGLCASASTGIHAQGRFLGREEIIVYGLGLRVEPAVQTVPKGFATIVSTFLQGSSDPGALPPFAPDAEVRATLRGPSFPQPIDLVARPNTPFNIPLLTVAGTHTLENIRLVSGGEVVLYGTPETARIEVIDKLLVTTVTARPLTAEEIREKGIVFDKSNFQAFNFTAAFAIDDGSQVNIQFPVVLPTLQSPQDVNAALASLQSVDVPLLRSLQTIIPDTLQIQSRIPNLSVTGFTLTLDGGGGGGQNFYVPPIPGVIVIPGDIGFLNQFFSVMLMVANVAPAGSNLVVSELTASIVLPPGKDNVVGSTDDPLAMARRASGETARVVPVTRPGPDGVLGTGDDLTALGPGDTGNAEFLVEGKREGTHVVEMELAGTLNGLPIGPVPVRGRAAGVVLVRNPAFSLTFTHPDIVNAGEPYTLDVTVTNTSESPANFVSLNLFSNNISGARLDDEATKAIESIAPGDSASVTYRLISSRTGKVTAATLDSDDNVSGRFLLKTAIGELGVPLSPDSLVLPKEANALPAELRSAALGVLGRAWAVATAPPAALPKDLTRFSKQVVLDRGVQTAEAGFRLTLGEPLPTAATSLLMDYLGSEYADLASKVPANDTSGLLGLLQKDVQGFDLVRRRSVRGDVFADAVATIIGPSVAGSPAAFHRALAEQLTSRPGHVSIILSSGGGALPVIGVLSNPAGQSSGAIAGTKVVKDIPFSDVVLIKNGSGGITGQVFFVAVPDAGDYTLRLARSTAAAADAVYDVTVAYPATSGGLQFASFSNIGPSELPVIQHNLADPSKVRFTLGGVATPIARPMAPESVTDPPPTVLGAFQILEADVAGCPQEELGRVYPIGRVIAVLFSEAVTPESVQDKLRADQITAFLPEGNRVVGVALQPGGRIAFLALREPIGPFVPRTITIAGVHDRSGQAMVSAQTVPIVTTVPGDAGQVSGRILRADGSPAAFTSVRLFYEFQCAGEVTTIGVAEEIADANGRYQFDYVLNAPGMIVKLLAVDEDTQDLRSVRFRLARSGQHLNVDVVFLGRGTLTGRTLAEDGHTPLANTSLRVTSATDQSQYGVTTDANGAFEIARIPVGNVLIEAVNVARGAQVFVSERIPFAGAVVARDIVLLDIDTTQIVVRSGSASGRVLRADGVTAVGGVPVIAYYRSRSQTSVACPIPPGGSQEPTECAIAVVTADANGQFSFPSLTAGELRLNTFDQTDLLEGNVRIAIVENQNFAVNILIAGGFGTVHGVVLDASGHPVSDAVVGGGLSLTNVNPADGTFTLTDVPVGRRRLVAVSQSLEAEGDTTIDIVQQGEVVNATVVLAPVGSIAGIVRNRDGVPQVGVKVWVFNECFDELLQPSVCVLGEDITDAVGAYRIDGLKVGGYRISAFLGNMKDGNVNAFAIRFNRQVLINDITFRGGFGTVTGRVLRACATPPCADTPLPAKVSISGDRLVVAGGKVGVKFEYVQNYEIADNDFSTGAYTFDEVWTGPFTIRAAGQFSPEPISVENAIPAPGATVTVDLRLQPTSRLTGTVFESDGFTPVTNRQVALRFHSNAVVVICTEDASTGESECTTMPQGIQEAFAATDAQGRFLFPLVNAGPFTLTATDESTGKLGEIRGTVRPGETVDVAVRLLGRSRVTVRVFRSDGTTPVPGASVDLKQIDYPQAARSSLAIDGTAIFEGADGLSEGQFVITAIGPGGFAGRASGRVVTDNQAVVVDVFLFDATGTVTGQVVREDAGAGLVNVPNAEVILSTASGPIAFSVTDTQGSFTIPLVPTGPFSVEAFDPVTAGRGRGTSTVIGGPTPAAVSVRLEALGSIRGTLVQSGSLAPLKGWTVHLNQTTPGGRGLPMQMAQTGVDGGFSFPGAAVGSFHLRAFERSVIGEGNATGQVTRGGQLVDVPIIVNITRRVTGRVAGLVAIAGGAPAPNAQVEVCASPDPCRTTTADGAGRFSLAEVPLGRFTVRASAQVTGNPSVGTTGGAVLFEGDTAEVTVTLLGLSVIEGTVYQIVNGARQPAPNATVRLFGQPGSGCPGACQRSTDALGRFQFINVPAQTFTVSASGFSGQQGSVGGILIPGETKTGLEIVLAPAVSLSGHTVLANGTGAGGVVAELTLNGGSLFAETDATGAFVFESVSAGAYTLRLRDPIAGGLAVRTGTIIVAGAIDLGAISLDEAPPMVVSSAPPAGAVGVPLATDVRVTFSERVNAATVDSATLSLVGPAGPVGGLVDLLDNDTVVRFRLLPGVQLTDQARYTLRVSGVRDLADRSMSGDYTAAFTTVDLTAPSIIETTPTASASGVTIDTTIRARFSEIIDPARFTGPAIVLTGPDGPIEGRVDFTFNNTLAIFTPLRPLAEDAAYTARIARATDLTGRQQASDLQFQFTTTDRTPPSVVSLTASNNGRVIENSTAVVTAQVFPTDVAVVDFFVNGVFAFADRLPPFAMTLQAAPAFGAPGSRITVSALATDTSGNRGVLPATTMIEVVADQPPTIAITQPAAQITAAGGQRIEVSVQASDDLGVTQVGYLARGAGVIDAVTRTVAPAASTRVETFAFNVPVNAIPGSTIAIEATAVDTKAQTTQATPVLVRVLDTVGPSVQITGVSSGQRVRPGQQVTVVVAAQDPGAVAQVGLEISGVVANIEQRPVAPPQASVATSFVFTVPANAASTDHVTLVAFALDAAGNRGVSTQTTLPVADQRAPTVAIRTPSGSLDITAGQAATIIVQADDDLALATVRLTATGPNGFTFDETQSVPPTGSASATFVLQVPAALAGGDQIALTARSVDASGNASTPVGATLTVRQVDAVTLPASVLLEAGQTQSITVTLGGPASTGGVRVDLVSRQPGIASITGFVQIAAGQTTAQATITAMSGGQTQIDASIGGAVRQTMTVTVAGGIVRGTVLRMAGNPPQLTPVAGVQVTLFHGEAPLSTTTAADGTFSFAGVLGGGFSGRDFSIRAGDGTLLGFADSQLSVPNGSANVSVVLIAAGSIDGIINLADGVTRAGAGVQVDLFETAAPNVVIATTFTDAVGQWSFPLVAPGPYRVDAADQQGNRARQSVVVVSGASTPVALSFLGRGTVTGIVRSGANQPIANAAVELHAGSIFGGAPVVTATSGSDGRFSFANVYIGTITVLARDLITNQAGSASGQLTTDGQTLDLPVVLSSYGNLRGTVRRADAVTIAPGASVNVRMAGGAQFNTTTDVNGAYAFDFLPFQTFTVTVRDAGSRGLGVAQGGFAASSETVTRDVQLLPQGALLVSVIDANGLPVNGATVSAQTQAFSLFDSLQGVTSTFDGIPGRVLLDRLLAGSFTASAVASGLSGSASGQLSADVVHPITITLEATATIQGLVLDQDGQTPASGTVRVFGVGGQVATVPLINGLYSATLRLGTYSIDAIDTSSRRRAVSGNITLASNGEVRTQDLTFVALGTVSGRVIHPIQGGDAGSLTVSLRSLHPQFGGFASAQTDAAGNYVIGGIPVGDVVVTSSKTSEQLIGEASGTLVYVPPVAAALSLDIQLRTNAVNLPATFGDGNGSSYTVNQSGGLSGGTGQVFQQGGLSLTLTPSGGVAAPFTGATFGTLEGNNREVVVRQDALAGLNVTRKVFVPATGYFARYLETLSNPTGAPIIVSVDVSSRIYGGFNQFCSFQCERTHFLATTSSGDAAIDVASASPDHWMSLSGFGQDPYTQFNNAASLGFVFDGAGAPTHASQAAFVVTNPNVSPFLKPLVTYGWQGVTVPPGSSVTLMHFVSIQGPESGSRASAARLVELPPEALDGLSPEEIASIVNFAVPANGTSALAALPAINGTIAGRILEGDGISGVAGAVGLFRSSVAVYPRSLQFGVDGNGNFSFTGGSGAPVPIAPFTLSARHPINQFRTSPTVSADFAAPQITVNQNVVFSDGGILTGVVRRTNGTPVADAFVEIAFYASTTTDANGRYRFGGVPAGGPTLRGSASVSSAGSSLVIQQQAFTLAAGQVRDDVLLVEPTGTVTGVLTDANGVPQFNRLVELVHSDGQFTRSVQTDSSTGRFILTDVRVGTLTLRAVNPANSLAATRSVVVSSEQTTTADLAYQGNLTLSVLVTRASGTPLSGMNVLVSGTGFSVSGVTGVDGVATLPNVPVGQAATILATHPALSNLLRASTSITVAPAAPSVTLALPAFGTVTGQVTRPNGTLAGFGISMAAFGSGFSYSANTDNGSVYSMGPIPAAVPFTLRASHPNTLTDGSRPTFEIANVLLATDGQALAVNTHYPAVSQLTISVTENGVPLANAPIQEAITLSCCGTFGSSRGTTNASGVLVLPQVVEGAHVYRVLRPGTSTVIETAIAVIGTANDAGNVNLNIAVNHFTLSIHGTVLDADGAPMANPQQVNLYRAGDRQWLGYVCVGGAGGCAGPEGQFNFTQFDAITAQLNVGAGISTGAGVIVQVRTPFLPFEMAPYEQTIVPTQDGQVNLTFNLPFRRATIQGRVVAADGTTLAGTGYVSLSQVANLASGSFGGFGVAADGSWSFGGPQFYPAVGVRAKLGGVRGVADGVVQGVSGAIATRDQVMSIDLVLPATTIYTHTTGLVTTGDGVTPLPGASIALSFTNGTCQSCSAGTDAQGRFNLDVATPVDGGFSVRASYNTAEQTRPFTAVTQGATVDTGTFVLPLSLLTGRVTFGPTTPARDIQVVVRSNDTNVAFLNADDNGEYSLVGLAPGAYTALVQHYQSGLSASTDFTIASTASSVRADVQLPPVGTVVVHVTRPAGMEPTWQTRVALTLPTGSFQTSCGEFENVSPDQNGDCRFEFLAPGGYYAQASIERCDQDGNCLPTLYSSASGTMSVSETLTLEIGFDQLGQVEVITDANWVSSGRANDNDTVRLTLRAMGATGSLGAFQSELSVPASAVGTGHLFANVPPGPVVVTAERLNPEFNSWEALARVESAVTAAHVTQPLVVDLASGSNGAGFWFGLRGADNWFYFIDRGGQVAYGAELPNGGDFLYGGAFSFINQLRANNVNASDARVSSVTDVAGGQEITIGPFATGTATYTTRRIFIPQAGRFIRYLDEVTNGTDVPVRADLSLSSWSNASFPSVQSTPSPTQGGILAYADGTLARHASVFAGINPPMPMGIGFADGSFNIAFVGGNTLIPARGKASLLHFVVQREPADAAGMGAQTAALVALTDPNALAGLSPQDLAPVVNYRFTHVRGRVVAGDGVTAVAGALVDLSTAGGTCAPCLTTADANGEFLIVVALPPSGAFTLTTRAPIAGAASTVRSFTVGAAGSTFNLGQIDVPGSVVTGLVTFGPSTPAPFTTVTVALNGIDVAFPSTGPNGVYAVVGLAEGTYTFTARHAQSGFATAVPVVIASAQTPVRADIELPPMNSVVVSVLDSNGDDRLATRVALMVPDGTYQRFCGPGDAVVPDANGDCRFEFTPAGGFYAQAMIRECDQLGCTAPALASTTGTLAGAGGILNLEVRFRSAPPVSIETSNGWVQGGGLNQGDPIRLTVRSMGANGPLAIFERVFTLLASAERETVTLNDVPPGRVVVTVDRQLEDSSMEAFARMEAIVPSDPDADPVAIDLATAGDAVAFRHVISGGDGFWHVLDSGGELALAGHFDGATNNLEFTNSFQYLDELSTNGVRAIDARAASVVNDDVGHYGTIGPFATAGPVYATRRVFLPENGGFMRYLDVFSNDTDVDVAVNVSNGSLANTTNRFDETIPSSASGGKLGYDLTEEDRATFALVFAGADAPQPVTLSYNGGQPERPLVGASFSVPAHSQRALLHFVVLNYPNTVSQVSAQASALESLTDPNALAGLTPEELAIIVNFRIPQ